MAPSSDATAAPSRSVARALPWIMWGLGALFYCYGFFQRTAPSVMVDELMRAFAVGAALTAVGVVNMLAMAAGALFQPLLGWLLDRGWDGTMEAGRPVYDAPTFQQTMLVLVALRVGVLAALLTHETRCRQRET